MDQPPGRAAAAARDNLLNPRSPRHEVVAQFSAQMPLLVRGMFFEGWTPAHTPIRDRKSEHFVAAIRAQVGDVAGWRGADDIVEVFKTLNTRISAGEIADIRAGLPSPIRQMWPS